MTHAIRELNMMTSLIKIDIRMIHKKEDFIQFTKSTKIPFDTKVHRCICADKEFAIFAPISKKRDGGYRTFLSKLWCCGQTDDTSVHDYERIYRGDFTVSYPS